MFAQGRRWLGPLTVVLMVAASALAWLSERPPRAVAEDAADSEFSAGRAMQHLRQIARVPHMTGSMEHARVRAYLLEKLRALGLETAIHETTVVRRRGRTIRAATVRSILGKVPGLSSTGAVALVAHYDSRQLAPGAGDDGAGVAAILEAVRALEAGPRLRNDLLVIFTDAEELGLLGAQAFVDEHPWMRQIAVLLNFEGRGDAGASVMFETGADNGWVIREFAKVDPHPIGSSLFYEIYKRLPNETDFTRFKEAGLTGLNFAIVEGADRYHRSSDTPANLSAASLQHHGAHALALARHFGNLELSATKAADVVFFHAPGLGLVSYSMAWVMPLTLVALALAAGVTVYGFRRHNLQLGGMVVGVLLVLLSAAVAAGLSFLLWRAVAGHHPELGSLAGRSLYDEGWYMLAVVALAAGSVSGLMGLARRWFGAHSLALGAVGVPLLLCVGSSLYMPGVNMLLLWPAVAVVVGIGYRLGLI